MTKFSDIAKLSRRDVLRTGSASIAASLLEKTSVKAASDDGVNPATVAPADLTTHNVSGPMRRRMFSRILVGESYPLECYLPQITTSPNFPTWSSDGREIAFAARGSIFRMKVGETTAHELTATAGYDSQPAWSPDGKWIAFTSEYREEIHLNLLNVEDGSVRTLTSGNSINVEPEWSPDGKRLAYVSTWPKGNFNIYVMSVEGGVPGESEMITSDFRLVPPPLYYKDMALHIHPTWTRDGKELIFVSNRDSVYGTGGFYRMEAKPGAPMKQFYYEETSWKARPTLSPDGCKLVYSSYLGRQWQQLWTIPPEGGHPFPLTYGDFDRTNPRWSPDGTHIAFVSNETGETSLWLFHWFGGKLEPMNVKEFVYKRPMGKLAVTVQDKEAGRPIAARVSLEAADGKAYSPRGNWARADWFMEDHIEKTPYHYFHAQGPFEVDVPPGRTRMAFSRGFEYVPKEVDVNVVADRRTEVTVKLERLDDLPAKGWWAADNHFHMNYAGVYFTSPEELMRQAEAEDIHVLNNLICNKEQRIPDVQFFRGAPDPVSTERRILYHNQEYHPPFWGHSVFLNLKKHLIIPEYVGYQETSAASDYPPNTIPFRVAREQGALAGYAHTAGANFPADLALGTADFTESNWLEDMEILYHAWNCGYRVAVSAGVDTFGDFSRGNLLGTNRVYVRSGLELNYEKWIDDFRAGRSFASAGALLFLKIDGREPGDEIQLSKGTHTLKVEVLAEAISAIQSVEVVFNGQVIETFKPGEKALKAHLEKILTINCSGWYGARVRAAANRQFRKPFPWAATMPIWVTVDQRPVRSKKDAQYFIDWLDRTLDIALGEHPWENNTQSVAYLALGVPSSSKPAWNNELEKEKLRKIYSEARSRLIQRRDEGE